MDGVIRYLQALVMVVALLMALAVAAIVVLPRAAGWTTLVVLSGSMEPAMPVGGLSFVQPIAAEDVRAGDVVTYPRPDRPETLVSHRVVAVSDQLGEPTLWTKGDANESNDAWAVPAESVLGRVRFTIPYLGRLSQHMQTPRGYLTRWLFPRCLSSWLKRSTSSVHYGVHAIEGPSRHETPPPPLRHPGGMCRPARVRPGRRNVANIGAVRGRTSGDGRGGRQRCISSCGLTHPTSGANGGHQSDGGIDGARVD